MGSWAAVRASTGAVSAPGATGVASLRSALAPERPEDEEEREPAASTGGSPMPYTGLTHDERGALLSLARRSIEAALAGRPAPTSAFSSPALAAECGAFVTLEKGGALRGCIGHVRAYRPLEQTVSEMAVAAALHDPRFPPVTADEFDGLTVEISVMSPLTAVEDVSEIKVGVHGLVIQDGGRSGLLLPQVATDYGWDRETFLEHTCMKAGLPTDCWKQEGVTILKLTAEVFGEE